MALGDANNQNKKAYAPTVSSRLKFKEADKESDKELTFVMNNGLLKVVIQRWDNSATKYEELQHIFLSQMKATIFAFEIDAYMKSEKATNPKSYGVMTGLGEERGIIYIRTKTDDETPVSVLTIAIVDANGNEKNAVEFAFNTNYHYGLEFEGNDIKSFVPNYYDDIEIDVFKDMVADFARNVSGAIGYSAVDSARTVNNSLYGLVGQCADKLGIERKTGSYNKSGTSFFDKNKGGAANSQYSNKGKSSSATLDDIESMIDDE